MGLYSKAQNQFDYIFYKNLINQKEQDLALLYLNNSLHVNSLIQKDSIHYLKGIQFYEKKQFDSSVINLQKIGNSSPIYTNAMLVQAIALGYLNKSELDIFNSLNAVSNSDTVIKQIKILLLASNAIINKNYSSYDSLIVLISDSLYIYNTLQTTLNKWSNKRTQKMKSGFVAGLFSAILPGLGKVYAGKGFDGLSTFFTHVPLVFILNESIQNSGVNSGRFITFASITSLFYIGNILTSYHDVKLSRKEVDFERKNEVLLQCNIMLRNYFN
jgi:TM2 domain-containing membrane protein YozV